MQQAAKIDAVWEEFCDSLPGDLAREARQLATMLGLAPTVDVAWSQVFKHEVTLAAPALFGDLMPGASPEMVEHAVAAHMLAVVEAFATDRISDRQSVPGFLAYDLLEHLRAARDAAMVRLGHAGPSPYREAERETREAIERELGLLAQGTAITLDEYAELSLRKQSAAFPASIALARAARCDLRVQGAIRRILEGIVLGLQFEDDVIDWEKDCVRGGAWAVCLARGRAPRLVIDGTSVRGQVLLSGTLAAMLDLSLRQYRDAARLAKALGAIRLAMWAQQESERVRELAAREATSPGYSVRAHQLAAWTREVLA